jgi:predicted transposase YbfD/YdcC
LCNNGYFKRAKKCIVQGRRNEREIPMAEVKMKSREVANGIRRKFAEKKSFHLKSVSVWELG